MLREEARKLRRDWDRPSRAVRLGRNEVAASVDLLSEFDFGVIGFVDADALPGEGQQLGEARASERGDGEEGAIRLIGRGDRLLELCTLEDPSPLALSPASGVLM